MPAAAGEEGAQPQLAQAKVALHQLALPTPGVLHWRGLVLALAQYTCRLWTEKIQFNSFLLMDN